jgi:F-type H+-transporting ATPase subunit b
MSEETYQAIAVWSEVVASALFILTMAWIFRKWIAPGVTAAEERKNAELLEAERQRNDAREEVSEAQKRLDRAQLEVKAIEERAHRDARSERDRILAEARVEGERVLHNAGGELARGRAAGRGVFRDELLEDALRIAGERASREVDEAANMGIINDVLDAVDRNVAVA